MQDDDAEEIYSPILECLVNASQEDTAEHRSKRFRMVARMVRIDKEVTKLKALHTDPETGELMNVQALWREHKSLWERYKMICLVLYGLFGTIGMLGAALLWLLQVLHSLKDIINK